MLNEIAEAKAKGAEIAGLCWYPIMDCPPWQHPGSRNRWSHGLIRSDLSVDPALSEALMEMREAVAAQGYLTAMLPSPLLSGSQLSASSPSSLRGVEAFFLAGTNTDN